MSWLKRSPTTKRYFNDQFPHPGMTTVCGEDEAKRRPSAPHLAQKQIVCEASESASVSGTCYNSGYDASDIPPPPQGNRDVYRAGLLVRSRFRLHRRRKFIDCCRLL